MRLTKQGQKNLLKRLRYEYKPQPTTAERIYEYDTRISAADEIEALNAEIHDMEGWIHTCPKCGFKCKECTCTERKAAELEEYISRLEKERDLLRDYIETDDPNLELPAKAEYPIEQWYEPPKPGVIKDD